MTRLVTLGLIVALATNATAADPPTVTSPIRHFGFNLGDDYCLANYKQLGAYWKLLAEESDRLKVVSLGKTAEGREQLMGVVTSAANHKKLAGYRDISRKLARVEVGTEEAARKLAAEGKAVVWIDGGLHATEVLCAQAICETLYRLISSNDLETLRILDDVIILFVHANPDGHDLVADWYMREKDARKRSLAGLPRLYQKYIGHDNNRDFYAVTQAETKNMNRVMYSEWLPQVVYNHHQTGPAGTVLFCPPFRDPFNYNVDPLVVSGIDALGAAMMQRFLVEGKPGATSRSGARYSTWWNGGLRTTCYFHNMIGLLTETIGSPTPTTIPFNPAQQLPKADYLAPIAPQQWHFRQSVEYSVTANLAILDYASRHREQLLFNIWKMGKAAVDRGNRDSWTITPRDVDEARAKREGGGRAAGPAEFARLFHTPEKRDPRGFVIPADQPDFLTATKFVNTLMETGCTVHRATAAFEAGGKKYPAGSYVVKSAQPFRAHVLDMFEPQDHPNDFAYPNGPPVAPYDAAGWTLAFQMGVQFDRLLDKFDGPFEELKGKAKPPAAKVLDTDGAAGFFLDDRTSDSFVAVNRLLKAGEEVRRLKGAFTVKKTTHPAGMYFIPKKKATLPLLEKIAAELGTPFVGSPAAPGKEAVAMKPVRVGLWDRYGGSMPSGWTRWILEQFEFPFEVVYAKELDKGNLRDKFDVLVFVDGAIPSRGGDGPPKKGGDGDGGGDQPGGPGGNWNEERVPAEYRERYGNPTVAKTVPELKKFLEAGGTVLTIGTSTSLANHFGLPVANHLVEAGTDGKDKALSRDKFYVPPSVVRAKVDTTNPLAWGMPAEADFTFANSPTFKLTGTGVDRVAWFDGKKPLRSGWALGQDRLDGGVAVAEAKVGKGTLVLYGPQILFRAQPHGTFKLFFNGLTRAGMVGTEAGSPR